MHRKHLAPHPAKCRNWCGAVVPIADANAKHETGAKRQSTLTTGSFVEQPTNRQISHRSPVSSLLFQHQAARSRQHTRLDLYLGFTGVVYSMVAIAFAMNFLSLSTPRSASRQAFNRWGRRWAAPQVRMSSDQVGSAIFLSTSTFPPFTAYPYSLQVCGLDTRCAYVDSVSATDVASVFGVCTIGRTTARVHVDIDRDNLHS